MSAHLLWLNREALPKFQSRCECGWSGTVFELQQSALIEGRLHVKDRTGKKPAGKIATRPKR